MNNLLKVQDYFPSYSVQEIEAFANTEGAFLESSIFPAATYISPAHILFFRNALFEQKSNLFFEAKNQAGLTVHTVELNGIRGWVITAGSFDESHMLLTTVPEHLVEWLQFFLKTMAHYKWAKV